MDLNEIKNWLTDPSERFIFVENGKPSHVLLGFEAYVSLKGDKGRTPGIFSQAAETPRDPIDLANARLELERIKTQELAAKLSMDGASPRTEEPKSPREPAEIRLEDLPL